MTVRVIPLEAFASPTFLLCAAVFCAGVAVGVVAFGLFAMLQVACEPDYPERDLLR